MAASFVQSATRLTSACMLSGLTPTLVASAYALNAISFRIAEWAGGQGERIGRDHRLDRGLPRSYDHLGLEDIRRNLWSAEPVTDCRGPSWTSKR